MLSDDGPSFPVAGSAVATAQQHDGQALPLTRSGARMMRVRVTDMATLRQKVNVTIPVSLIQIGIKLGARLLPPGSTTSTAALISLIESGVTGRLVDVNDLDAGEHIELFVE